MAILNVIKYEGDNRTFVWKHPATDFSTGSQLIVHESQEAILFLDGRAMDSFGPGRHELTTQNLPLIGKILSLPTGGEFPFHAEVYFVNLVEQMGIPWGTKSKVQFMEPSFGFPLSIGASGEMALKVEDPRRLLIKLVGTEALLSQDKLISYFKGILQARLKTALAQAIADGKLSIFEMDAHLDELSSLVCSRLVPDFSNYGMGLTRFVVTTVVRPEGDQTYERFKDLYFRQYADVQEAKINQQVGIINEETNARRTVIAADAAAAKRKAEGYTYQQERGFDVAERIAKNDAVGEYSNMGIGLGVMTGIGGQMAGIMGDAVASSVSRVPVSETNGVTGAATNRPVSEETPVEVNNTKMPVKTMKFCPQCGYKFKSDERFCPQCGTRRE